MKAGERAGGGGEVGKGVPAGRPCSDGALPQLRSWGDDRKWFEVWDEDTVGTFSNLDSENNRTGESCLLGGGNRGFSGHHWGLGKTQRPPLSRAEAYFVYLEQGVSPSLGTS